jgi:translation elongation factor EF-1beta
LPLDWNVDINNLDERVKVKMEDEATKLEKLIEALKSW